MHRFLLSILLVTFMTPFHLGCGGGDDVPIVTEEETVDPVEELDPATEAAAVKEAQKSQ
ncbi:MAG: hypothetical protein K0U86_23375 [Planctomycetes bacterium]|uniref:hypothetical protein n=1 Tax=uncultured Gimesia sp. TaxID=1678688 RepID=UPI00261E8F2E|nr:hypothetical protein [uncultured Gimesia sp.]MCH9654086.1 hypothetical protein [Planctomycetota bacterium]MCH9727854.1 hypothetical protein [Planctomycetota bacterium]MCH9775478.1 hypothetical protein [Planctomycetota bacterium]